MRRGRWKLILSCAWLMLGQGAVAQGEDPLGKTLEGLLTRARANNPELAAMQAEQQAASERIEPAGALPDPRFRMELRDITRMGEQNPTLAPNRVGSTRYVLMQDIPWWGKRDLRREVAELEASSAESKVHAAWHDVASRLKSLHFQRIGVLTRLRLTQEVLDLLQRLERIAQVRYASGLAAQQDVVRAQVEQSMVRDELIGLAAERQQIEARIVAVLGLPAGTRLVDPDLTPSLPPLPSPAALEPAAMQERVLARNPQLGSEQKRVLQAEKTQALVLKNRYPDFNVSVAPIQVQNSIMEWELMLEFNIPLQQGARRAQEREAQAMLRAAQSRQQASQQQMLGEISETLAALESARRTEQLVSREWLPQAELTFSSALAGYENGKVDFSTLLEAQRQIRQARLALIKAQVEARQRLAEVQRMVGDDV